MTTVVDDLPARPRTGPTATDYKPKEPPPVTFYFAARTKRLLAFAARRVDQSKSTLLEHLIRLHGGAIQAADIPERRQLGPTIRPNPSALLTAFAKRVLAAAERRTGRNRSHIMEALVQRHVAGLRREDFKEEAA